MNLAAHQLDAGKNDDFLQGLITKYAVDGEDGIKMISKKNALLAAASVVKKFRELTGKDNKDYLDTNFGPTWDAHDITMKNQIDATEAYQLFNEL